jgi:hypothetical protein
MLLENASETGSKWDQKRIDKEHTLDFVACSAGIVVRRHLHRCNASGRGCQAAINQAIDWLPLHYGIQYMLCKRPVVNKKVHGKRTTAGECPADGDHPATRPSAYSPGRAHHGRLAIAVAVRCPV